MRFLPVLLAGCVIATGSASTLRAQRQPIFRLGSDFVEIDAVATDRAEQPVSGLTRDDFRILEDGSPREIEAFAEVRADSSGGTSSPTGPAPTSIVRTNSDASGAAIYVLVIDDLHVDARSPRFTKPFTQFVEQYLATTDIAAVVRLGFEPSATEFTSDKRLLLAAAGVLPAAYGGDFVELKSTVAKGGKIIAPTTQEDSTLRTLDGLRVALQYLSGIRGRRKSVVLFSNGFAINSDLLRAAEKAMLQMAADQNASIYGIDPRGLSAVDTYDTRAESLRTLQWATLRAYGYATGGLAAVEYNFFDEPFRRIVADSRDYYILAYRFTGRSDGKFHSLNVRTVTPGVTVRTREGFHAPGGPTPPPWVGDLEHAWETNDIERLLKRALPTDAGVSLRATASPVQATGKRVTVQLVLEGATTPVGNFDLGYDVMDADGSTRETHREQIKAQSFGERRDTGWRYVTEVTLDPGIYQLRAAVRETGTDRAGSVFVDVGVPDLSKGKLFLGVPAVTWPAAGRVPTVGTAPSLSVVLPTPVTTTRTFSSTDILSIVALIVGSNHKDRMATAATVSIVQADGEPAYEETTPVPNGAGVTQFVAKVPLRGLSPGVYALRIAAHAADGQTPITRVVPFEIR